MPSPAVLVAQVSHESNTFNPCPTDLASFTSCGLFAGTDVVDRFGDTDTEIGGFLAGLEAAGAEAVGGISASAIPSGPVSRACVESLKELLLEQVAARRVEGVLLALHGAMVDEHGDVCELEILRALRDRLGPGVPIACTFDLHTNLRTDLLHYVAGVFPYDTNPHVDLRARGEEAAAFLCAVLRGDLTPTSCAARVPLLLSPLCQGTAQPTMRRVMEVAAGWESRPGIVNVAVFSGFAYADVPHAGLSVVATTDADEALAREAAQDVARAAWALREDFARDVALVSTEEAIAAAGRARDGVVVIAEVADNVNAGTLGEGTHLLNRLVAAPLPPTAFAAVADPAAVSHALGAGVGSVVDVPVGGKVSPVSGPPVSRRWRVQAATDGSFVNLHANNGAGMLKGFEAHMGRTVVLDALDVPGTFRLVVSERPVPPLGPEMFASVGIPMGTARVLVVKTRGHYWRPQPSVTQTVEVDTPGMAAPDVTTLPYARIARPIYPLDR